MDKIYKAAVHGRKR